MEIKWPQFKLSKRALPALLASIFACVQIPQASALEEHLEGISKMLTDGVLAGRSCEPNNPVTIGIWPFDEANIPIGSANAKRLYSTLLSSLLKQRTECLTFFDGNGVQANIDWLQRTDAFRNQGTKPLDVIEQNLQNVDFHFSGRLFEQNQKVQATFKAVERQSGATLVTTKPIVLSDDYVAEQCGDGAISPEAAARSIGQKVNLRASSIKQLIVDNGYFQDTNAQTAFSRYMTVLTANAINEALWDPIKRESIDIRFPGLTGSSSLYKSRGLSVEARAFDSRAQVDRSNEASSSNNDNTAFSMSLRYWLCGDAAKTRISVNNRAGENIEWLGSISLASIPNEMEIKPAADLPLAENWGPSGAFSFAMTTDNGANPYFRPGETMVVHFQLERDSWLYCFYVDSAGTTIQVLPNIQQDQTNSNRNFFKGSVVHALPDANRPGNPDNFEFKFNDLTTGVEVLKCLAVSRNITAELPLELRGQNFNPIPLSLASRLREIFQRLPNTSIAEKSVTVTVSQ
ncbi:MAG: DUF4384 domain-containing protein [Lentilitoribacter sp.]